MSTLTDFIAGGSQVGDLKYHHAGAGYFADPFVDDGGTRWLQTANYIAYSSDYSRLLTGAPRLLRTQWATECEASATARYGNRVVWDGTRYVFLFNNSNLNYVCGYKTSLSGVSTDVTNPAVMPVSPGGAAFLLTSGANAGRICVIDTGGAARYMSNVTVGSWTAGATSGMNTGLRFMTGKTDGTLLAACVEVHTLSAGQVVTSTDGGNTWTSRTATTLAGGTSAEYWYSSVLNRFFLAYTGTGTSMKVYSASDGYTFTDETTNLGITTANATRSLTQGCLGENSTYAIFAHPSGAIYRNSGGGWSLATTLSSPLYSVVGSGSNLYGMDFQGLCWVSTNNGTSWSTAGYLPAGSTTGTASPVLSVANGKLFAVRGSAYHRLSTNSLPGAADAPDLIGIESVSAPYNYVRIK